MAPECIGSFGVQPLQCPIPGIGIILEELKEAGYEDNTLVIYSSDNGIPFPNGRTNMYEPGIREPMIIYDPTQPESAGKRTDALVSLLDITPTVLDWFEIKPPKYDIFNKPVTFTGVSLLPLLGQISEVREAVFASHSLHEVTMFYPMRVVRTTSFKLVHNLNFLMPFPVDQDLYISPTFQDILNRTHDKRPLPWLKTLWEYYYRDQWEMYHLDLDPEERCNIAHDTRYAIEFAQLRNALTKWQWLTNDPWICAPGAVLEDSGQFKENPQCLPLFNGL